MPCYMCKSRQGPFQMLEVARLRFIRKAQPLFRDNSYLCSKCFAQFESIYKSKAKSKNGSNSSRPSISNVSIRSVSTNTHNSKSSSRETSNVTAVQRGDGNNNNSDNPSVVSVIHFDSHSMDSPSSDDTTDRIVQMVPDFLSLRDSSRKTTRNPELNVARQGAEAAVRSAMKRQRIMQPEDTPPTTPTRVRRDQLQIVDEETSEDEDIASRLSPNNLAHVRPVVRRRKEPVVQQFDDIMDLYIARTSGG